MGWLRDLSLHALFSSKLLINNVLKMFVSVSLVCALVVSPSFLASPSLDLCTMYLCFHVPIIYIISYVV